MDRASKALETAATAGSLVICDLVYAELCVGFDSQEQCDEFLTEIGIRIDALSRPASFFASRVWRKYREQGGKRERILADFLIGAHAAGSGIAFAYPRPRILSKDVPIAEPAGTSVTRVCERELAASARLRTVPTCDRRPRAAWYQMSLNDPFAEISQPNRIAPAMYDQSTVSYT